MELVLPGMWAGGKTILGWVWLWPDFRRQKHTRVPQYKMMSKEQATAKAMTELSEHSSVAMKLVPPVFQSMGETLELVPVCGLG